MNHSSIIICIVFGGEEFMINTFTGEYRSLMALIRDKIYPGSFGECGGQGRCGTCLVQLDAVEQPAATDRNEQSTLVKLGITDPHIRLSCQILIDDVSHHARIIILDMTY